MIIYKCEICGIEYSAKQSNEEGIVVEGICGSKCVEKYVAKYMISGADSTELPKGLNGTTEQLSAMPPKPPQGITEKDL